MRVITVENPHMGPGVDCGESSGYLIIPERGHPWFGKSFRDINVDVHGGLCFSGQVPNDNFKALNKKLNGGEIGAWAIGFHTRHPGDTREVWTDEAVRLHAEERLLKVAENMVKEMFEKRLGKRP